MIRILSPVLNAREAVAVIEAGAKELYCGVMPGAWKKTYSNVASLNRREWASANMNSLEDVRAVTDAAHRLGTPVFLTLNALYTEKQYPEVRQVVQGAASCGIDALIIADLGLLLSVRDMGWQGAIHVSTGGTTFNDEAIAFYRSLGAERVILPRHNRVTEIAAMAARHKDVELETFVMNSGCMNIDGFCTHHHGIRELTRPVWWNIPKMLHADHHVLRWLKRLPSWLRPRMSRLLSRTADSSCLLAYDVDVTSAGASPEETRRVQATLRNSFGVFTGFDTCGACSLWEFDRAGITSVKIVGRNNPVEKKVRDVRFLRDCLERLADPALTRDAYAEFARERYRHTYGFPCDRWCYFPEEDLALGPEHL